MYWEIEKKIELLEKRRPFSVEVRQWIQERDQKELVFFDLKAEGSEINREDIDGIFRDELVKSASIRDYAFLKQHRYLMEEMRNCLALENTLNTEVLLKLYRSFTEESGAGFRTSNAMITELQHVPVHGSKIDVELDSLFGSIHKPQKASVLERAAFLHNRLAGIVPFESHNLLLARAAMNYFLAEHGYPMIILGYSRTEYMDTVRDYLHSKEMLPFYKGLERAMYNKLEVLLQATEEE